MDHFTGIALSKTMRHGPSKKSSESSGGQPPNQKAPIEDIEPPLRDPPCEQCQNAQAVCRQSPGNGLKCKRCTECGEAMACTYAAVPKLANSDTWSSPPSIQWAPTVFRDSHQQGSQETYPQRARNPTPLRPEIIHGWASDIFPPSTIHTPSIRSVQIEDTIENIGEESVLPAQPSGGTPPEKSSKDENGQSG